MHGADLKYTLCFCMYNGSVLLLQRKKEPNKGLWNGLGGKIEADEDHRTSVIREVLEEADIDLEKTSLLHYKGVVTWRNTDTGEPATGMHIYLAELQTQPTSMTENMIDEGTLAWHPIQTLLENKTPTVVSNIPVFFPHALTSDQPHLYHFSYTSDDIADWSITKLGQGY